MPPPVWNFILTNGGGKRFSPPCVSSPFFSPPLFFPRKSLPHCINNMAPPPHGWGCHVGLPDRIQNPSAAARGGESFSLPSAFPFFFLKLSRMSLTRRKSNMAPPPQGWGCHVGLPDRIRTCGLESRSLALYPAGLRVDYRDCATDKKNGFTPLVDPKGFEPSTSALRTRRSPN